MCVWGGGSLKKPQNDQLNDSCHRSHIQFIRDREVAGGGSVPKFAYPKRFVTLKKKSDGPLPEQLIFWWRGTHKCKVTCVLCNLTFEMLLGTQSQRPCPLIQMLRATKSAVYLYHKTS